MERKQQPNSDGLDRIDPTLKALAEQAQTIRSAGGKDEVYAALLQAIVEQEGSYEPRRRLLTWLTDDPRHELAESPDFQRYEQLLPDALSGLITPADAEWFHDYLERCPACEAEYHSLLAAANVEDDAIIAAVRAHTPELMPTLEKPLFGIEETFAYSIAEPSGSYNPLQQALTNDTSWANGLQLRIQHRAANPTAITLRFERSNRYAAPRKEAAGHAREWVLLFSERLQDDVPGVLILTIRGRRSYGDTCELEFKVNGSALEGNLAGIEVDAYWDGINVGSCYTNKSGAALLTLPLDKLLKVALLITLPVDRISEHSEEE